MHRNPLAKKNRRQNKHNRTGRKQRGNKRAAENLGTRAASEM